jgi:hypothetical protein
VTRCGDIPRFAGILQISAIDFFQQVMADCGLSLAFTVENKLTGDGEMRVEIPVRSTDSFEPESAASAVPALIAVMFVSRADFLESSPVLPVVLRHIVYFVIRFFMNRQYCQ